MKAFSIEILGVCNKKNQWRPKKGGVGITSQATMDLLDRMAMQVPSQYRDLCLESPDLDFYFTYRNANWDLDGAFTTLLDILGRTRRWGMRVIKDDNIAHCRGRMTIHPAVKGDYDGCRIVITPREDIHDRKPPQDDQTENLFFTGAATPTR